MGGIFIQCEAITNDPLLRVRHCDHRGVNYGTPLLHAQDGTGNRLKPPTGQSDGAPPAGLRCELSPVEKVVPWPFPGCPGSSHTCNGLYLNFNIQHCGDNISILVKNRTLSPGASTAGENSWRWGCTPGTMPQRTSRIERNDSVNARPYKANYRKLWCPSRSMWRICHRQRPSLTSGRQSTIITVIWQLCTRTWGRRRGGEGWLWGRWRRQEQQCGTSEWCIRRLYSWCSYTAVKS